MKDLKDDSSKKCLVLVYGSLREGKGNHSLIERTGKKLIAKDVIIDGYDMIDLGAFPGIFKGDNKIVCELYETTEDNIKRRYDVLEGYDEECPSRSFYLRKIIDLPIEASTEDGNMENKAYIYELNVDGSVYGKERYVESIDNVQDWVKYHNKKIGK